MIRKGLVVFQFTLSVALIISVGVVHRQMDTIRTRNLGYDRQHVIQFAAEGNILKNTSFFADNLQKIPGVTAAATVNGDMLGAHSGGSGLDWKGKDPHLSIEFGTLYVDYGFVETMSLRILQGHSFSKTIALDSTGIILNESAVKAMHIKDPVGQPVKLWGEKRTIIGIVKDFNAESLYKKVGPFFLAYQPGNGNIVAKIAPGTESRTLSQIAQYYRQYNKGLPFEYTFLEEDYQALYATETRLSILSRWFAGMAILISCLGLFGLASFTAQRRQKEIGVRKVIGASVTGLVMLLSKDFLRLIILAMLIAFPLAGWLMSKWLDSFAYRAPITAGIFLLAGAVITIITLASVGFQSIRAAIANPIKALRAE